MSDPESGYKWWLRYVLVPMIGGGGVIALLVAAYLNRPAPTPPPIKSDTATHTSPSVPAPTPRPDPMPEQVSTADVENLVSRFVSAWLSGDADGFVALAGVPFFFDKELVLSRVKVRERYVELSQQPQKAETWRKLEVRAIKVQTLAELAASGRDMSNDRIVRSMNLSPSDFAVTVQLALNNRSEGVLIVVRRRGPSLEIAGMWD